MKSVSSGYWTVTASNHLARLAKAVPFTPRGVPVAVLSTILVILGAWCAVSVVTAALYAALRHLHVRRQRAAGALPDAVRAAARCAGPGVRTGRPGQSGRSDQADRSDHPVSSSQSGRSDQSVSSGHPVSSGRSGGSGRSRRSARPGSSDRPRRPAHPSGRSGWGRRVPPPDLQTG